MSFLGWTFLFGVLGVAGPMLAHLLARPRYRRVPFTMIQFLRRSRVQRYSRTKLRDILLLLLRCVIIILIAVLFARPMLRTNPVLQQGRNNYYLGLDDSVSMAYDDGSGSYFGRMKQAAEKYIDSGSENAVYNIYSLAGSSWSGQLTKQQAIAEIKAMQIKYAGADVRAFLDWLRDISRDSSGPADTINAVIISDFTKYFFEQFGTITEPVPVNDIQFELITSDKPIENLSIINALLSDYQRNHITIDVIISNNGTVNARSRLLAKDKTKELTSAEVDIPAGGVRSYTLQVATSDFIGQTQFNWPVELALTESDGLAIDNSYCIAVRLPERENTDILLVETKKDEMFLLEAAMQSLAGSGTNDWFQIQRIAAEQVNSTHLDRAEAVVFSDIFNRQESLKIPLNRLLASGGRVIFFVTRQADILTAKNLYDAELLPAMPTKYIEKKTYPQAASVNNNAVVVDAFAAGAMTNYRIEQIPFSGYWLCEPEPESLCLWQYQDGTGFIYSLDSAGGVSILVNSAVDSSVNSLCKSPAAVAFCRYLLGPQDRIQDYSFRCDEPVYFSIPEELLSNRQKTGYGELWIENCSGKKQRANLSGSVLTLSQTDGTGWLQTIDEPVIYAGINLPEGETEMSRPQVQQVQSILSGVFQVSDTTPFESASAAGRETDIMADNSEIKYEMPIWRYFAWAVIVLILIESAIANRLKR